MTKAEIMRMAKDAGAMFDHMTWIERDLAPVFERFADLVAAAERDECANLCENLVLEHPGRADLTAHQCVAAIRARGQA